MSTNEADTPSSKLSTPGNLARGLAERWPFRRKLNLLVGVPLAVVATLLAYLITDQVGQARDAAAAARLVRDSVQVAELVDRVEVEHQQAILLSVRHEAEPGLTGPALASYRKAQAAVDAQVKKVRDTFGERLPDTEAQALKEIGGLDILRHTIESGYTPADNIDPAYTNAAKSVIDGLGLEHNAALATTFTGNLLDSLLRADAAHSSFETSVFSARTGDSNALIEFINAVSFDELYTFHADRFARFATAAQAEQLSGIKYSPSQATILQHYAELQIDPSGLQADSPAEVRKSFAEALESYPVYREQAENRLKITAALIDQIADRADRISENAYQRASLLLALALFGFVGWLGFSVVVRRSVVRPVQALTGAAREVADVAGRELARVADDDAEDAGPPRLREVPVTARDEIGELAAAFNRVQTTAAALLERQVLSRRNVAEMFGNVGRRVSNLTTRQLSLIDAVERSETDPDLLERLYSIDHIAVRLRRNADSLMLLAGIRETVLDSGPAPLTDVVRAALGQIEGFRRVRLTARTQVMVEPDIIGDLTLMVAELLENAVSFSPADSQVEVGVSSTAEGALIEVADHGLGMSPERLAEENARLVRRERLDLVPTKVLGLFVVGTLARRWGIEVALGRTVGGGLTALVTVPSSLLLTMSPVGVSAAGSEPIGKGAADEATPGPGASSEPTALSGQLPSTVGPAEPTGAGRPAALPHRGPGRDAEPAGKAARAGREPSAGAPFAPTPRSGDSTATPTATEAPSGSARPLRRRVRGATLRTDDTSGRTTRQAARPADAEAVRSLIEEFEAAVERAHRDSTATPCPATGVLTDTANDAGTAAPDGTAPATADDGGRTTADSGTGTGTGTAPHTDTGTASTTAPATAIDAARATPDTGTDTAPHTDTGTASTTAPATVTGAARATPDTGTDTAPHTVTRAADAPAGVTPQDQPRRDDRHQQNDLPEGVEQ